MMAEFVLHHTHQAEDCQKVFDSLSDADASIRGKEFLCTCPSGDHGGFYQVEAAGSDAAIGLLPQAMRATTVAYPVERMTAP